MPIVLGSEWCHNLAHAAAARAIGKPVDAIRITWGMPLLVYYDINDKNVFWQNRNDGVKIKKYVQCLVIMCNMWDMFDDV